MKKVVFSLAALAMLVGAPSFAKEKKVVTTTTTTEDYSSSGPSSTWFGVSSDSTAAVIGPGLSALFVFNDKLALQTYLALGGTSPFLFGAGGQLKFNVAGTQQKGFHLGGGFGIGSISAALGGTTVVANIYLGVGLHFTVADNVMVIADGSAAVRVGGGTTFTVGTNGTLLGLSLLYRL